MRFKRSKITKTGLWIIGRFIPVEDHGYLSGDMVEAYTGIREKNGRIIAFCWFWLQVLRTVPPIIKDDMKWGLLMLKNYLKMAFRNIAKQKLFSLINIAGLATGIACVLLILFFVTDELSYDNYHEKGDRIFRLISHSTIGGTTRSFAISPSALAPEMTRSLPEVESFVRIFDGNNLNLNYNDKDTRLDTWAYADSAFFNIFSYDFIAGDPETALEKPSSLVLTETAAMRIFGSEEPFGKSVSIPRSPFSNIQITGVIKDVPENSHYRFDAILSMSSLTANANMNTDFLSDGYYFRCLSYILLNTEADAQAVYMKTKDVVENAWGELLSSRGVVRDYELQPLRSIHLNSKLESETGTPGSITYVYLFAAVALSILLIACFNFINLSTARSVKRAREVGMRKAVGAYKAQLINQFLSESVILSLISVLIGVLIAASLLPIFNSLTGKNFSSDMFFSITTILWLIGVIIITGVIAGSFPAFMLSSFHPVEVLKGKFLGRAENIGLRKILVVLQFSISIFIIISTIIILNQLDFLKNKDLGFDRDQMAIIRMGGRPDEALRNSILQIPSISAISMTMNIPGQSSTDDTYTAEGKDPDETIRV
ncbi:ABC transporter permease, partial [candidate division KSB1 bacterium]